VPERPDTDDYRTLFLGDVPMMDMRAPAEFAHGAFPQAASLPLMSDDERARVGICYKERGQQAAIELGHQLVAGEVKASRMAAWSDFARRHPEGYLYCFRGGLRSRTVQQWLREAGIDYPLVLGGYKAMRRYLLEEMSRSLEMAELVLISGKTGTGKTRVVQALPRAVDLEGLAGHRGSTFGELPQPQPAQIDFENALSIALLKLLAQGERRVFVEDEGRLIGRIYLPEVLRDRMKDAPLLVVEQSLEDRIDVVVQDYVIDLGRRYLELHGDEGPRLHAEKMQSDLYRIRKRLGGQRHAQVGELMTEAFVRQRDQGDLQGHRLWIAALLEKYYDPMYEYQLSRRGGRQLFRGDRDAVVAHALSLGQANPDCVGEP
jgi:tRNA 2-selenouridine synthase